MKGLVIKMDKYEKKILKTLIDKYESSKSFSGQNKVNQSFTIMIEKLFPHYTNDAEFDIFVGVNEAVEHLVRLGFIQVTKQRSQVIVQISLVTDELEGVYTYAKVKPRSESLALLRELLYPYSERDDEIGNYARTQLDRIGENKKVEHFTGDIKELQDVLKLCDYLRENQQESYIRDVSIRVLSDSKRLESLRTKVEGLLFQYGDYEEKQYVLEECGVVQTPTYVVIKGKGQLIFDTQIINLSELGSDIALSTNTVARLKAIEVEGSRIVTIENLTSFHTYSEEDDFAIYLGGFHNKVKAQFIQKIHEENPEKEYLHFGDIDAGGFYIYEHLKRKTKIPFGLLRMDVGTLEEHRESWKILTENDKKRLRKLLEDKPKASYRDTIKYMLKNTCKLEQEVC